MRKFFIVLFFLLHTFIAFSQQSLLFRDYLARFETAKADTINNGDFMSRTSHPLSPEHVQRFVNGNSRVDEMAYLSTIRAEEKDFIIAVITKEHEGSSSYNEKCLYVYSKNGDLVDSMTIVQEGARKCYTYAGTWHPFNLKIKEGSVTTGCYLDGQLPLYPCLYNTYQYSISPKGKIVKTLLKKTEQGFIIWDNDKEGIRIVKRSKHYDETYIDMQKKTYTFESYISKFKLVKDSIVTDACFETNGAIPLSFVKRFVENKKDNQTADEDFWYQYLSKIETPNFTIALVNKSCDTPHDTYPYSDLILIVYSKRGKMIDSKKISRIGDLWECNYGGSLVPFRLTIEQASVSEEVLKLRKGRYPLPCKIRTSEYSITQEGQIQQRVISEEEGTIIWDKTKNKRLIVKDHH